jgi:hypothetical protein
MTPFFGEGSKYEERKVLMDAGIGAMTGITTGFKFKTSVY